MSNFQWYPGHMTKARRMMQEDIRLVDLVIELIDARVPVSSRNPDIDELGNNKSRVILLNKSDLADPSVNASWVGYFQEKGYFTAQINARSGAGMKQLNPLIQEACREKIERDRARGIKNRPVRAMVCGIPNVGKSTFINSFAGRAVTKTGNKPGVTKGKQWIRLNKSVELLDTPGILWPKFEDPMVGMRLAAIGSIRDEILNVEEMAVWLIGYLQEHYPGSLAERYSLDAAEQSVNLPDGNSKSGDEVSILFQIARRRACLKKGGEPDAEKASALLIDDFRSGKLGKISLEIP